MADLAEIAEICGRVLERNWREGTRHSDGIPFAYTAPSPGHYPWQWYWDSCFTAIVWRRFDPARGRRELESLLAAAHQDGFIGHTIFWNTPLTGVRRATYNVIEAGAPMTASIQPPMLAWAWRITVGDPAGNAQVAAHHDWIERHRDLDGDGLVWIVQPDESGLDASNQFDPIWGSRAHGLPGFLSLVRRNRRLAYDLGRVVAAGGPAVAEIATNVLHGLSRLAMGRDSITPVLVERCWDESRGLFMPLVASSLRPSQRRDVPVTWAALAPLALPDLPVEIGRRLVEEHLLDPAGFWSMVPVPSVSLAERSFSLRDSGLFGRRYWRGPSWVNASWLLWLGLRRLGYAAEGATLANRLLGAVTREGLREYYDPISGRGMGARQFGWSALAAELADPDPSAAFSHLGPAGRGAALGEPRRGGR